MREHFLIAVWARDAVISGDLESLREPLRDLANYQYASVAPGGWMDGIAQLQAAARLTSQAPSLTAAAMGVAAMGRICGECHRAQGRGPVADRYARETKTPKSDTLTTRMYRHAWAADRLWEGLIVPSDQTWRAGASALSHAPEAAPKTRPKLPAEVVRALDQVRELGVRAEEAETLAQRSDVYGLLLATCANCHAFRVEFDF